MMANVAAVDSEVERPVAVWIEDHDGRIVRGVAESVTTSGAQVRLSAPAAFRQGAEVALRISFDPGAPTVATTARVSWVRSEGGTPECALAWTGPADEVARWLESKS
jgi:hypothetical protein